MSIIQSFADYISTSEIIGKVSGGIQTKSPCAYLLPQSQNVKIDINGGQEYTASYYLIVRKFVFTAQDVADLADDLQEVALWITQQDNLENLPQLKLPYYAQSVQINGGNILNIDNSGVASAKLMLELCYRKDL